MSVVKAIQFKKKELLIELNKTKNHP